MLTKSAAIVAVLIAMGLGQPAFAATAETSEVSALAATSVTAADATASVEAQSKGKVVELTLATAGASAVYNVTVQMPDGTESNFTVDAKTGAIAPSADAGDKQSADNGSEPEDGPGNDSGEGESGSN